MVRHRGHTGPGNAAARMIVTGCVDCSYGEIERTNPGHDAYKTAHGRSDSIGKGSRMQLM